MGFWELLVLLLVVLLFFGASKLPAIGEGLGKAIKGFKESMGSEPPSKKPAPPAERKDLPPRT
jgi:sec-independent protein translocase protein TatA